MRYNQSQEKNLTREWLHTSKVFSEILQLMFKSVTVARQRSTLWQLSQTPHGRPQLCLEALFIPFSPG